MGIANCGIDHFRLWNIWPVVSLERLGSNIEHFRHYPHDPTGTDAESNTYTDSDANSNTGSNSNTDSNPHTDSNTNADSDSNVRNSAFFARCAGN